MSDAMQGTGVAGATWPRTLAHLKGERPGPLLIALGGIHGNEPAGLVAAARVLDRLSALTPPAGGAADLAGDFVVLAGNRAALARGVRYVDRDLNRCWSDEAIARLPGATDASEDVEQRELLAAIEAAIAAARGPVYLVDLHTTSAEGVPFVVAGDSKAERAFAEAFGPAVFLGLVSRLSGALTPWLAQRGVTCVAFEGGQNEAPASVAHHEAALWVALAATGILPEAGLPDFAAARALLLLTRKGLPHAIRIDHRHPVAPGDGFRMEPGFANIQSIAAGTLLARDRGGEIRAHEDCLVVMPLYQGQGDDGFFLGRPEARA